MRTPFLSSDAASGLQAVAISDDSPRLGELTGIPDRPSRSGFNFLAPVLPLGVGGNGNIAGDFAGELDLLDLFPPEDFLSGPVNLPLFAFARATETEGVTGIALLHSFSGSATLTYDFTKAPDVVAVPVPASLPLFAAGLAVLGLSTRRRELKATLSGAGCSDCDYSSGGMTPLTNMKQP